MTDPEAPAGADRPLRRARGGRRATLPAKPGTDPAPHDPPTPDPDAPRPAGEDHLTRERPPHWG
ncbi:hypothetical protein HQQ81_19305 [Microbacteriaceae bacterium VKM Ac-2854]|nr:hypothetical protein [Microbacteriaceae bacterium VKM Ac-2854]